MNIVRLLLLYFQIRQLYPRNELFRHLLEFLFSVGSQLFECTSLFGCRVSSKELSFQNTQWNWMACFSFILSHNVGSSHASLRAARCKCFSEVPGRNLALTSSSGYRSEFGRSLPTCLCLFHIILLFFKTTDCADEHRFLILFSFSQASHKNLTTEFAENAVAFYSQLFMSTIKYCKTYGVAMH